MHACCIMSLITPIYNTELVHVLTLGKHAKRIIGQARIPALPQGFYRICGSPYTPYRRRSKAS